EVRWLRLNRLAELGRQMADGVLPTIDPPLAGRLRPLFELAHPGRVEGAVHDEVHGAREEVRHQDVRVAEDAHADRVGAGPAEEVAVVGLEDDRIARLERLEAKG